jgi:hypothetical protein
LLQARKQRQIATGASCVNYLQRYSFVLTLDILVFAGFLYRIIPVIRLAVIDQPFKERLTPASLPSVCDQ